MPALSLEHWGVVLVLLLTLSSGLGGTVFGLLGWLERRRERERQAASAGVPSYDQPLHERYVSRTVFDEHVRESNIRFRAASDSRKEIHEKLDLQGARISVLENTDAHHSRLLHSIDEKLTRLTENLLRERK